MFIIILLESSPSGRQINFSLNCKLSFNRMAGFKKQILAVTYQDEHSKTSRSRVNNCLGHKKKRFLLKLSEKSIEIWLSKLFENFPA
jgi:hypothetical protein